MYVLVVRRVPSSRLPSHPMCGGSASPAGLCPGLCPRPLGLRSAVLLGLDASWVTRRKAGLRDKVKALVLAVRTWRLAEGFRASRGGGTQARNPGPQCTSSITVCSWLRHTHAQRRDRGCQAGVKSIASDSHWGLSLARGGLPQGSRFPFTAHPAFFPPPGTHLRAPDGTGLPLRLRLCGDAGELGLWGQGLLQAIIGSTSKSHSFVSLRYTTEGTSFLSYHML